MLLYFSIVDVLKRNIVILLDDSLTSQLIQLSEEINSKIPSAIILNAVDMYPHITLYTTNYPRDNEELVMEKLSKLSQNVRPFSIVLNKPIVDMLGVWINAAPNLQRLHELVVDTCNPSREGLYDEKELIAIGDNTQRQESLKKWGMWAAKELYIPHITLSRPIDSSGLEEALHVLPEALCFNAQVKEIAYVERGPHGTCKKILEKFSLLG